MIVGQSDVHDRSRNNLRSFYDRTDFRGMHAENCTLRHVYYWSSHHGAEDTAISNRESSSSEIFEGDFSFAGFKCQICQAFLEISESKFLAVAKHWHDKTVGCRNSCANINEVAVDHF